MIDKYKQRSKRDLTPLHLQASIVESSYGVGRLKGRKEGKAEGMKEGMEKVALNLLDILDDATIAKKTGLTVDEIRELRHGKK